MKQEPDSRRAAHSGRQGENPPRSRGGGRQCHPDVRGSDGDDMRFPVEFLRLSVDEDKTTYGGSQPGSATVVLDRAQVERLRNTLNDWLNTEERF
jgi:hypothetical protein